MAAMGLLEADLRTAEFVAVDVETNGRAGEDCEITELGAVLVGGCELHDEIESLVRVERPLSRGIERLTGITQAMVDAAPSAHTALGRLREMLEGRVLVAHSASFDRRALHQGFARAGLDWPDPPVICTISMARRYAPLAGERKLAALAASLGIGVDVIHRALPDARTCARIFCALFPRLCASVVTVGEACELLAPRRRRRRDGHGRDRKPVPREQRPDLSDLSDDSGVYVFRDHRGRPLYVGKSVSVRTRARSHFCAPAGWTERAEVVDYIPTRSELGALVLENRLIKRWRPAGNKKLKHSDGYVYVRCRLDIAFPILEVANEPAAGLAVNVGPLRGRAAAAELVEQLNSIFGLRRCGRTLPRRDHPSAYGQMGRCLSPCLRDLDPNLYRRRLDEALGAFDEGAGAHAARLIARLEREMREASEARLYERASALLRRRDRLETVLGRLTGLVEATHARSRLVVARHPAKPAWDAFWIVRGRVVDWGELSAGDELSDRTRAALERNPAPSVPAEEVDEVRIVHSWLASNEPPQLELTGASVADDAPTWARQVTALG
jgi:DNA polymerase III subunit epsilon